MLILFGNAITWKDCAFYIKKANLKPLLCTVVFSAEDDSCSMNLVTHRKNNGKFCD